MKITAFRSLGSLATATVLLSLASMGCEEQPKHLNRTLSSWTHDLGVSEPYKQKAACEAMVAFGPKAATSISALAPLLEQTDTGISEFAASALAAIGKPAQPALEEYLGRPEPAIRMHAASALVVIDPLHDKATKVLVQAVTGVGNAELAKLAQEIVVRRAPAIVPALLPAAADPYGPVRLQVLKTLALMKERGRAAVQVATKAIDDKDQEIRVQALRTLAAIGEPKAIEPILRKVTDDEDEDVATVAAMMMKYIGLRESASGNEGVPDEEAPSKATASKR